MNDNSTEPQGFLRLHQILQIIPVGRSTWWDWVKTGKAPTPIKLSPKVTVWKVADIQNFIDEQNSSDEVAA